MLLLRLKEKFARRRKPLKQRLEQRRKLIGLLRHYIPSISILLYFVGVIWLLLLPYNGYNKETYVSENALLPAQVNVYYSQNDVNIANEFRDRILEVVDKSRESRAEFIFKELRQAGFHAAIQHYTTKDESFNEAEGVNAFGIYHAPRSDGTEALLLSAPWVSRTGEYNVNGIASVLSLAKLFKRNTYWSKDIIILITDESVRGMQAWLNAYHGVDFGSNYSSDIMPRSGAIQAAINMDFPGTREYESLAIYFEGANGQLPNLDLINTVITVAKYTAQVPFTLHDNDAINRPQTPVESYLASLKHLTDTIRFQALGHPSSDAGLALRYKIDAITIHGITATGMHQPFDFHRMGILVESTFRSLNNLLEHLHQSFFFYFLTNAERYVSIGMYMPPVILFACCLVLQSLVLWYSPARDDNLKQETGASLAYSTSKKNLGACFSVLVTTHAAGLLIFYIVRPAFDFGGAIVAPNTEQVTIVKLSVSCGIAATAILMAVSLISSKQSEVQVMENWRVLKSLCLALTALIVASISLINFSLGAVMGLIVVIPYSLIQPTAKMPLRLLQAVMLTVLSPVVTLYLVATLSRSHVVNAVTVLLTDYEVVDVWLLAFMCTAYWPVNMALYTVIFA
ncbi:hypothetical protein K450DRAFT_236175 [Umbelopsis ramanniana AG]|uniref:Gaa1-domain-containing protein n=1 Tax=Umbelopsis ramanniana AG TaxID=1314678 RepID=A0AAD5EBS0_UMBRA|nr:uncharacterized protein K450DRAFT_236175 [Umbelopsis ramanniana AG]KAI8580554.1 hypothetical protein K450DRAFT_236175 [Umbelopsis ramanniana AG]